MLVAVADRSLPTHLAWKDRLSLAADSGFAGIELTVPRDGVDGAGMQIAERAALAQKLGLRVASIALDEPQCMNLASDDAQSSQSASENTIQLLDLATELGAEAVRIVPVAHGDISPAEITDHHDALWRIADALLTLRIEAEARGVTILLDTTGPGICSSLAEIADLIDHVNSPYVAWMMDPLQPSVANPEDWILALGGRIGGVRVSQLASEVKNANSAASSGSAYWPRVIAALRAVGYDGALTYAGTEDIAAASRVIAELLATPSRAHGSYGE